VDACGVCGGQLDALAVRVTMTFASGPHGQRSYRSVPWKLDDWSVCWACISSEKGTAIRKAMEDEYCEPVIVQPVKACHTVCAGGRIRARRGIRRFFSTLQGSIGEPQEWARCPVCFGACEVERAA